MLVQLRRVVYLLVLLQCCVGVCLVRAERGTAGNGDHAPKVNELNARMSEADEAVVNANACMEVWKKEVESCNDHVSPVKDATEKMKGVVENIMNKVWKERGKDGEPPVEIQDKYKEEEVATLLEEAKTAIQEVKNAANKAKESITKVRRAEQFCAPYIDKVEDKMEDKKKLEEEGKRKVREFTDQITDSEAAMKTAKNDSEFIITALGSRINAAKEKEQKNEELKTKFTTTKGKIEVVEKVIERELVEIEKTKQPVETQEAQDELAKELEKQVQRLKAEKQSATEQERKEKEQSREEEGKKPSEEKGEKGAKEEGAQVNGGSKEKPQGNAEKETNTPAETNVQTTEAPVKEEGEKGETTGDSTQKPGESLNDASSGTVSNISLQPIISGTSDSSNSPALVHSPLLLLLLCVLGSILVC